MGARFGTVCHKKTRNAFWHMPSATKAHRAPLNTTRKTESRPCCSLDNRPATEAFPVRGLERKRGLRCYSCRSVQPAERVARRPSEHSAGGHTTHQRKTNRALTMMIVEGLMACISANLEHRKHHLYAYQGAYLWHPTVSHQAWVGLFRPGIGSTVKRMGEKS
jgi:hypothetical protein